MMEWRVGSIGRGSLEGWEAYGKELERQKEMKLV
jgi:hypothetical protein